MWTNRVKQAFKDNCSHYEYMYIYDIVICVASAYRQVSNIRRTLVGNKIVDHSDVVGVGAAPTISSFST